MIMEWITPSQNLLHYFFYRSVPVVGTQKRTHNNDIELFLLRTNHFD